MQMHSIVCVSVDFSECTHTAEVVCLFQSIYISRVTPGGAAERTGKVEVGDKILSVGVTVVGSCFFFKQRIFSHTGILFISLIWTFPCSTVMRITDIAH